MATTTYHAQLIKYTESGDQYILNLKNTGDDVSISRSSNGNIPSSVTTVQTLANKLGSLAFQSSVTGLTTGAFASNVITQATNITAAGYIADARVIKTLNDAITTANKNITALNSNLASTNTKVTELYDQSAVISASAGSWTGTTAPYSCKLSCSVILADSNVDVTISTSATDAQRLAFVAGAFVPGAVTAGAITILAYGKKPKVDLPLVLIVRGKEKS